MKNFKKYKKFIPYFLKKSLNVYMVIPVIRDIASWLKHLIKKIYQRMDGTYWRYIINIFFNGME